MTRLLAIILMFFAVLPHPALIAGAWTTAPHCKAEKEVCPPACPCCAMGGCACVKEDEAPPPAGPQVPVSGADFHPQPALPPSEKEIPPATLPQEKRVTGIPTAADRARSLSQVPLHVRHCAFLI